jgi:ribosomal protein S12 methylthiotransferase
MNVHFVSLGCPKNRVDTEVMLGHTAEAGHHLVADPEAAEVIVVNTCGFIGEAKQESIDAILEMARHKQAGTCKRLVVAGCLSQRYPKELADEMPEVDHFIGTDEVGSIAKAIGGTTTRLSVVDTPAYLYDDAAPRRRSQAPHSAYVKIAEGCDRPCAFCIIPKLRGPQRSRLPLSGSISPARHLRSVVLPAPLRPISASRSRSPM